MTPLHSPHLLKYLMDGLPLNRKTNKNIGISNSLKYKHSKKKSLRKKYMIVQDEINLQEISINQKPNSTMSVMLCAGATFVNKKLCLVARIVSFDTVGLYLLTFHILEPYLSKDIAFDLSHVVPH